jgi:transposase
VKAFVEELERHGGNRENIQRVSLDLSAAYQKGVREYCPQAQMIFDKFHLVALTNRALDRIRRAEARRKHEQLKRSGRLWLMNPQSRTPAQAERFDRIDKENLVTALAYQMRLCLQDIYQLEAMEAARRRFQAWCRWVRIRARRAQFNPDFPDGMCEDEGMKYTATA